MNTEPLVTVLMSVYNSERYLRESVESILNQTFFDFEFLIINDASTDRSREIILSYSDPRIILIDNEVNIGLTRSLNKGLEIARGKYIARMDADDISMSERLEKQVRYMDKNIDDIVLGSWAWIINETGAITGEMKPTYGIEKIYMEIFFSNPIIHSSSMFRRDFIINIGGYDEKFDRTQDYDLWLRVLARQAKIENIPEYLLKYRLHIENVTHCNFRRQEELAQLTIKNAYQWLLKENISLKKIEIIRKFLYEGNIHLSWKSKFSIYITFKRLQYKVRKFYKGNSILLACIDEKIGQLVNILF